MTLYSVFPGGPTSPTPHPDVEIITSDNARCAECGQTMGSLRYWVRPLTGQHVAVHPGRCLSTLQARELPSRPYVDTSNRGTP